MVMLNSKLQSEMILQIFFLSRVTLKTNMPSEYFFEKICRKLFSISSEIIYHMVCYEAMFTMNQIAFSEINSIS